MWTYRHPLRLGRNWRCRFACRGRNREIACWWEAIQNFQAPTSIIAWNWYSPRIAIISHPGSLKDPSLKTCLSWDPGTWHQWSTAASPYPRRICSRSSPPVLLPTGYPGMGISECTRGKVFRFSMPRFYFCIQPTFNWSRTCWNYPSNKWQPYYWGTQAGFCRNPSSSKLNIPTWRGQLLDTNNYYKLASKSAFGNQILDRLQGSQESGYESPELIMKSVMVIKRILNFTGFFVTPIQL